MSYITCPSCDEIKKIDDGQQFVENYEICIKCKKDPSRHTGFCYFGLKVKGQQNEK